MHLVKKKSIIKFGHIIVIIVGFQFAASILSGTDMISGWWKMPADFSHRAVVVITSLGSVRLLDDIYCWLLKKFDKTENYDN